MKPDPGDLEMAIDLNDVTWKTASWGGLHWVIVDGEAFQVRCPVCGEFLVTPACIAGCGWQPK